MVLRRGWSNRETEKQRKNREKKTEEKRVLAAMLLEVRCKSGLFSFHHQLAVCHTLVEERTGPGLAKLHPQLVFGLHFRESGFVELDVGLLHDVSA
jgi:hypothetical protein